MTVRVATAWALVRLCDPFANGTPDAPDDAALLALARAHRLSPYIHAVRGKAAGLPEGYAHDYRRTLGTNLHLLPEGRRVRDELAGRGIRSAFRKGMRLIGTAYPDEGMRPIADIDLYVEPADAREAAAVIAAAGFRAIFQGFSESAAFERRLGGVRCIVDLHWDLGFVGRCRGDWRRIVGGPIGDDGELTPEAFAADLVGHLWHHGFRGLFRYLDFALLVREGLLDPPWLRDLCRRLGMGPAGERVLACLSELWDVPGCGPRAAGARQALLRRIAGAPVPLPDGGRGVALAAFVAGAPADVLARALLRKARRPTPSG